MTDFGTPIEYGWQGPGLAAITQILNAVGALTLVYAFRYGRALVVAPLANAGAPMITAIVSMIVLGAMPNAVTVVAIALAFLAAALLADRAGREGSSSSRHECAAGSRPPSQVRRHRGDYSVCSAHPLVLEAALRLARRTGGVALIEATSNQVNQDGGYTGMRPAEFRERVLMHSPVPSACRTTAWCWAAIIWAPIAGSACRHRRPCRRPA